MICEKFEHDAGELCENYMIVRVNIILYRLIVTMGPVSKKEKKIILDITDEIIRLHDECHEREHVMVEDFIRLEEIVASIDGEDNLLLFDSIEEYLNA